ncbi:MAG TPA: hypothetical protein VHS54_03620 [Jatrophihabitans sp.]|nr:hypothetical protein [Jatrophihabitans sp.]
MTSPMSNISVEKRRQLAATLGLFSVLFIAIGAVAATGAASAVVKSFVVIALLVALVLALMAWGVARSVKIDLAEQRLDAVIDQAVQAQGASLCSCGHEHDPDELHVTDDPCEKDGRGHDCTHSCDTCVLARLRPAAVAAARRPRPGPRGPSPSPSPR